MTAQGLIDTTEMYLRTIFELEEEGVVPLRARIACLTAIADALESSVAMEPPIKPAAPVTNTFMEKLPA